MNSILISEEAGWKEIIKQKGFKDGKGRSMADIKR